MWTLDFVIQSVRLHSIDDQRLAQLNLILEACEGKIAQTSWSGIAKLISSFNFDAGRTSAFQAVVPLLKSLAQPDLATIQNLVGIWSFPDGRKDVKDWFSKTYNLQPDDEPESKKKKQVNTEDAQILCTGAKGSVSIKHSSGYIESLDQGADDDGVYVHLTLGRETYTFRETGMTPQINSSDGELILTTTQNANGGQTRRYKFTKHGVTLDVLCTTCAA